MSNNKAFPTSVRVSPDQYDTGMDLRDYFAIHCPEQSGSLCFEDIQSYLKLPKHYGVNDWTDEMTLLYRAEKRYEFADAMLKARKKK